MSPGRLALIVAIACTFGLIMICAKGSLTVCTDGCGYGKIQSAVDAASAGDTIEVRSGTYNEELSIGKQIVLDGIDTGDGKPALYADNGTAVYLHADDASILGFDFTGCKEIGSAIRAESVGSTVYLNNFADASSITAKGISFWNSSSKLNYQYGGRALRGYLGNYWRDYKGDDENRDGIGDEPVYIDSKNVDLYPLMQPAENYIVEGQREEVERTINSRLNVPFNISIRTNPASTYEWFVDYDYHTLRLDNESFIANPTGYWGTNVYTFTPIKVKSSQIYFVYRRPWDNIVADTRSFLVFVG